MLDEMVAAVENANLVGCAVGLLPEGQDAEFSYRGECTPGGAAISEHVLWEAASLSKPVVALLAAELAGKDPEILQGPLTTDLSSFGADQDGRWPSVRLHHLLTHSAGLPNWRVSGEPLGFESDPGTPGYSGEGFELALRELSSLSGLNATLLLERHLEALAMRSSTFLPTESGSHTLAIGHDDDAKPRTKTFPTSPRASGSLHTTVPDFMRFLRAVARPAEVGRPSLREGVHRTAQRETEVIPGFGRTLGWAFAHGQHGDVLSQHGDNPGFKHIAAVRPATGEALLVLTNDDRGQGLYRALCKDFLDVDVW